jgi:hypothetical protein
MTPDGGRKDDVNSWKVVRLAQIPIGMAALGVGIYDITRGDIDNVASGLLVSLLGIAAGVMATSRLRRS